MPDPRRRAFSALFTSAAISTTGFLAITTANSLIAEDLLGAATWSGIPAAAAVLGTALGANALARVISRTNPRDGLVIGYAVAAVSTATAAASILMRSFTGFVLSMLVFGAGYGANRLARYVAADLVDVSRRATTIGWIVWASTIGAAVGPLLLKPTSRIAERLALPSLSGTYLACLVAMVLSCLAMLGSARGAYVQHPRVPAGEGAASSGLLDLLAHPGALLATVTMMTGQFVMVLVMTVTPVHVRHGGHDLTAIGIVISAHTLGMFAIAPLTGMLSDRAGRLPVIVGGVALLAVATALGALVPHSYGLTVLALLLLGIGWNCGFVAGSALLTDSVPAEYRVRLQGFVDGLVWGFGALASAMSGLLLERWGFVGLCAMGAVLACAPAMLLPMQLRLRRERASRALAG